MSQVKKGTGKRKAKGRKNDAEWRLLHEQETRKRREELLEVFMKDKILRETPGNRLNVLKLNWKWRSVLRDIKSEELKVETQTLEQTFDHLVDTKNRIISSFAQEIQESKNHQTESVAIHFQNLDQVIDIQEAHLKKLHQAYETQKLEIIEMLTKERSDSQKRHQTFYQQLKTMESDLNKEHDQFKTNIIIEYQSLKDELLNKSLEEQHSLRIQLGIALEGLWQQIQQVLRTYHQNVEDKKKIYYELKAKDEKTAMEIAEQTKKQLYLEENVSKMKAHIQNLNAKQLEADKKQNKERQELIAELQCVREKIDNLCEENSDRMGKLTMNSRKALDGLEANILKGRNLLKLEEICMKYEAPTGNYVKMENTIEGGKGILVPLKFENTSQSVVKHSDNVTNLENLWKRYNDLNLNKYLARDECQKLHQENVMLQNILKKYLNDLSQNLG